MAKPKIQFVDPDATMDEMSSIIQGDGCLIIPELVNHACIDALMADLQQHLDKRPTCEDNFLGTRTKRLQALIAKSQGVGELLAHEKLLELMDRVLGPYCDTYTLSSNSLTVIGPDETPQPMHRDDALYPFTHPTERHSHCTAFWALSDFTESNGATRLVPGSHLWDDKREPTEVESVQAIMPKGSVCIFVGAIYHGGSRNVTTNDWRIGMFAGYILGWLRQEQNFYLTVPPKIARTLPEKVARLIGYEVHKPFLGFVTDFRDPYDMLRGYEEGSTGGRRLFAEGEEALRQSSHITRSR